MLNTHLNQTFDKLELCFHDLNTEYGPSMYIFDFEGAMDYDY